ncbi:MAG: hypothetical protein ACI9WU_005272 [Myxococcota bacterium]|jgi:hypothetical protein
MMDWANRLLAVSCISALALGLLGSCSQPGWQKTETTTTSSASRSTVGTAENTPTNSRLGNWGVGPMAAAPSQLPPAQHSSQRITPLPAHAPFETSYGYRFHNPVHAIDAHFRVDRVSLTRPGAKWTLEHSLEGWGRAGALRFARDAAPREEGCTGTECSEGIRYDRAQLSEWYQNTLQGVRQGYEISEQPLGDGPLVLRMALHGLSVSIADSGKSAAFTNKQGDLALTLSPVRAVDAYGRTLGIRVERRAGRVQMIVDDAAAQYPIVVESLIGSCPPEWCDDGDASTVDTCSGTRDGDFTCANPLDSVYEDRPCSQGEFCCPDRRFHSVCGQASVTAECPEEWCYDGDPSTAEICKDLVAEAGLFVCQYTATPAAIGASCEWGARCCRGKVAETCDLDQPGNCPDSWCNDGDGSTLDLCDDYHLDGTFSCKNSPVTSLVE